MAIHNDLDENEIDNPLQLLADIRKDEIFLTNVFLNKGIPRVKAESLAKEILEYIKIGWLKP